jgi:hypothetical protein
MKRIKYPPSAYNWLTITGALVAGVSFSLIVFLALVSSLVETGGSYLGLIIFILLPSIMVIGLLAIPIGMLSNNRRRQRQQEVATPQWPNINLNDTRQRNAFLTFIVGTVIFLFVSAVGSYSAFHYTESVSFCGTVCHRVMEPEYTAYSNSPHARVACADCHVGSGADWYVRSKLSGLYQVYSVLTKAYSQPIPTPIHNLRPAREICEKCHWPQKFYSHKARNELYYLTDDENTPWNIQLTMKIGSSLSAHGLREGIHWHINPDVRVEYLASDDRNMTLPWVRYTNISTGESKVFIDEDADFDSTAVVRQQMRTMDCIDCHNRPSHNFRSPARFVDEAITAGVIPQQLPGIKSLAMEIFEKTFPDNDSAFKSIAGTVKENYDGEVDDDELGLVDIAVAGLQQVFRQNIFPYMGARWSEYPNHIGHLEFDGCFRCHNDRHVSEDGEYISRDCNLCHIIGVQGELDNLERSPSGKTLTFVHPGDVEEDEWQDALCTDCHTGLSP